MSKLKFSDITITVEDLDSRATRMSEGEANQVLGGRGWIRRGSNRKIRKLMRANGAVGANSPKPRPTKRRPKPRPKQTPFGSQPGRRGPKRVG